MKKSKSTFINNRVKQVFNDLMDSETLNKKRKRSSLLDPYQAVIFEKNSENWSCKRILDYLQLNFGVAIKNRSTIHRRLQKWIEKHETTKTKGR